MGYQSRFKTSTRTAAQLVDKSSPYELLLAELREVKSELHNLNSVVAIVQQDQLNMHEEIRDMHEEIRDMRKEILGVREEILDTRKEIRDVRKEVGERMNHLETEIRSTTRHSQILTTSVVGIAVTAFGIATAVVYSMLR